MSAPESVRPSLPPLSFLEPDCPKCGQFVRSDPDGYYCEPCGIWWHRDGSFDGWVDCD